MSAINWGDVPTWLGTTFATAAAGAAVWTLKSQRDQIREQRVFISEQSATMELERAELRATAEDRRVAQARQVRMYHSQQNADAAARSMLRRDPDAIPGHWSVEVVNDSEAPLRDLEVRFGSAYTAAEVYESRGSVRGERLTLPVAILGARRRAEFLSQRYSPATLHNNRPTLYFTDDGEVRWSLDSYGKLAETDQQSAE
ncbi:hypothetical protein ACFY1U_34355 [Streptomyces sp. NPDC001351]|uniref:hypothetical protein n=1 Tax=Streptomyces sp. NPDC001351 TaxID=3364564 RepID=UPI0036B2FA1C